MLPFQTLYESSKNNNDPAYTIALLVLLIVSVCGLIYMVCYSIKDSKWYKRWKEKRKIKRLKIDDDKKRIYKS
jgi:hypothetical protein